MYEQTIDTATVEWTPLDFAGVAMRTVRQGTADGSLTVMTRLDAGATIPAHSHTRADETAFVVSGDLIEDGVGHGPGTFFVAAAGTVHGPHGTAGGCVLLTTFSGPLDFVPAGDD